MLGKKGGKFGASLLLLLLFSNVQETDSRFIGAKTVLRSAPSSSFAHGLPRSYLMLSSPTGTHGVGWRASSYLYSYHQGLGFGLFSSLYCCQMGPAVNLNGLSIIYIKYTYDYVPYTYRRSGGEKKIWKNEIMA